MQTLCHLALIPHEQAKKYGQRTALVYKDFGGKVWKEVSWTEFSTGVKRVAEAMRATGIERQENVGVFSQNSLQYLYTDFGAWGIGAVTVPFYATSSEQQLQYIINDAQIRTVFVGEQEQYDKARRVQALCPTLERIIIYDGAVQRAEHDGTSEYWEKWLEDEERRLRLSERRVSLFTIPSVSRLDRRSITKDEERRTKEPFEPFEPLELLEPSEAFEPFEPLELLEPSEAFEPFELFAEREQARPKVNNEGELANILYTSGTTGEPKGVMLSCEQYMAALKANGECVKVGEKDRVITFLPMTHIFERGWDMLALSVGATLIINTNPHEIQEAMRETHPTCMAAVPRFWEKVYAGVMAKMDGMPEMQRRMLREALATGYKYNVECKAAGKKAPLGLTLKHKVMDRTVLAAARRRLGLERPNIFPTAGAVVSKEVEAFVHSLGLNMIVGYGLTESLATVTCDRRDEPFTIGSVGQPIDTIDIRIGENSEILLKGPTITQGYYRRDDLNREAFTEDGYFRTGDAGYVKEYVDKDGRRRKELFLTERIKDLYKTSNGKYVAPQAVESKLLVDKYIEQIAIIADERKFVSALIVPAYTMLENFARDFGIAFQSREDLCSNPLIIRMLTDRINTLQQGLAGYEQVKRFTLLTEPFTMENGELTNTLKTRRRVIIEHYHDIIEKMYEE